MSECRNRKPEVASDADSAATAPLLASPDGSGDSAPSAGYKKDDAAAAPVLKASEDGKALKTKSAATGFEKPSRETIMAFLANGTATMLSDETRQLMKDPSVERPGVKLIELQRAEWDALGVDRDFGCNCLDRVHEDFPGDNELVEARLNFVRTAERTFLKSFADRAPSTLEESKPMPRETILQFFDLCNTQMNLPEFHDKLVSFIKDKKGPPNQIIIDMQKDMLEVMGFEREYGCRQLSAIGQRFPKDQELHRHFQGWQQTAQNTCMQLVKMHMKTGGNFVGEHFADNPYMKKLQAQAREGLATMTPAERGQLLEKMQKKISVFAQLPPDARETHMKRLPEEQQLEFVKAQILLVSVMKQQWEAEQGHKPGCDANNQGPEPQQQMGSAEEPEAAAPAAPPPQQMTM